MDKTINSFEVKINFSDGPHAFNVDASQYNDFYGNKIRTSGFFNNFMDKTRKRCRDTNMISTAFSIMATVETKGGNGTKDIMS